MDPEINVTEKIMIGEINRIEKYLEKIDIEYAREERRRGFKKGCCLLIFIITIIILYYGLDFFISVLVNIHSTHILHIKI